MNCKQNIDASIEDINALSPIFEEIKFLVVAQGPNIVKLNEICICNNIINIVMEYTPEGTLS